MKRFLILILLVTLNAGSVFAEMKCDFENYEKNSISYLQNKDFNGLIELTTACINENPDLVNLYNNRGNAYKSIEKYDEAMKDYDYAISKDPEYTTPYIGKAHVYLKQEKLQEAIAMLDKVIEINPNIMTVYNSRAVVKSYIGDFDGAIKDWQTAKKLGFPAEYADRNISAVKTLKKNLKKGKK